MYFRGSNRSDLVQDTEAFSGRAVYNKTAASVSENLWRSELSNGVG